ncbi:MAG: hypothetical protein HOH43_04020 [Candidatus Latescibacteria bacterium]|jgi:predicted peptidase|nr:hypothetical protein [Candidatus Latescibacterota bacterium]
MLAMILAALLAAPQATNAIDIHERLLTLPDGNILRYTIAVPASYTGDQAVPLVLALHYGGWEPEDNSLFYGKGVLLRLVEPALSELGAIIIAPDCPAGDWTEALSVQATLALLDHTTGLYNIDQSRTLVTGYSLGGNGTWHMAQHYSDRFRAAIPIAASPPLGAADTFPTIPTYVIHSRADEVVPFGPAEEMVGLLKSRGFPVAFLPVEEITHHQTVLMREHLRSTIPWIKQIWGN